MRSFGGVLRVYVSNSTRALGRMVMVAYLYIIQHVYGTFFLILKSSDVSTMQMFCKRFQGVWWTFSGRSENVLQLIVKGFQNVFRTSDSWRDGHRMF